MKYKALALVVLLSGASGTYAQEENSGPSFKVLEELVVTARKKEESAFDVPVAVTGFSSDAIEKSKITDIRDLVSFTPSLNYNAAASIGGGGRVNPNTTFRGMQNGTPIPQEQVGSTFIDGIFVTGGPQSVNTIDVERIEVLKGPQSVYFGRSTFGGAINYVTKTPGAENRGEIRADIASYDSHNISFAYEGPIVSDKLFYRLSAASYKKGAMYQSSTDGGDLGRESTQQGSLTIYATPSDNTTIKFRASIQEDDDSAAAIALLAGNEAACNGFSYNTDEGRISTPTGLRYFCGQTVPSLGSLGEGILSANTSLNNLYPPNGQTLRDVFVGNSLGDPFIGGEFPTQDEFGLKREVTRLSLSFTHEFANQMELAGNIAYNDSVAAAIIDIDSIGAPDSFGYVPIKLEDTSAEIRLRSAQDQKLRWLLGANWYDGEICCEFSGSTRNIYGIGFGPGSNNRQNNFDTLGLFGSVEYDINDQFTMTFEGRYQEDEIEAVAANTEVKFDDFIPRVIASWSASDNTNVYASYSRGVLPGTINSNFIDRPSFQQQQIRDQVGNITNIVDSDELDSFEIGIRQKLMGGRARYSLTAYYAQWGNKKVSQNIQVSDVPNGPLAPANSVVIAGDQDLYGLEFEGSVLLNDYWQVHASASYNHSEYTRFFNSGLQRPFGAQNFKGKSEPQNPEWSGSVDLTYANKLNEKWDWYARTDAAYRGKSYLSSANIAELDSFVRVNAQVGFEKEDLTVALYVNNVFDNNDWASGGNIVQIGGLGSILGIISGLNQGALVQAPDKRQVGIKASFSF